MKKSLFIIGVISLILFSGCSRAERNGIKTMFAGSNAYIKSWDYDNPVTEPPSCKITINKIKLNFL